MVRRTSKLNRHAFTITEMLVTVGVIVVLAGILVTALAQAGRAAQRGKTDFLMQSIKSGIERFRADHGYIPPVLGPYDTDEGQFGFGRDLLPLPEETVWSDRAWHYQGWYSMTSLPEYLLGYGNRAEDGYGYIMPNASVPLPPHQNTPGHREHPALGMRSPGPDGVWNATLNPRPGGGWDPYVFRSRNPNHLGNMTFNNQSQMQGKVYGPYIDLKDATILGEITGLRFDDTDPIALQQEYDSVLLPGDEGYGSGGGFQDPPKPKVFVDYWGNPIRFYRRVPRHHSAPETDRGDLTLGDIIALRPHEFDTGMETASGYADANDDVWTSRGLLSGEFALFSAGADRKAYNTRRRVDNDDEYNKDNIVEVGP